MSKKIHTITFLIILFFFPLMSLFSKDKLIDEYERRYLKQFSEIETKNFTDEIETYISDQFPFRYNLRQLKGFFNYNVFNRIENQDIVIQDDSAIKIDLDYNYDNTKVTIEKLMKLRSKLFKRNKCYFALIPDKNCYYNNETVAVDYNKVYDILKKGVPGVLTINTFDKLNLSDYYTTDSHWSQENIVDVSNLILEKMRHEIKNISYTENKIQNFNGVYVGQSALPLKPDTITYLTTPSIDKATVFNFEANTTTPIYDLAKLEDKKSLDNYDIFLSGACPLLKINNPDQTNGKTLILFRDSYGSSIAPLFVEYYTDIYVVDLRYMDSTFIEKYIDITPDMDVLFLYSTTLLEIPNNFKIN